MLCVVYVLVRHVETPVGQVHYGPDANVRTTRGPDLRRLLDHRHFAARYRDRALFRFENQAAVGADIKGYPFYDSPAVGELDTVTYQ